MPRHPGRHRHHGDQRSGKRANPRQVVLQASLGFSLADESALIHFDKTYDIGFRRGDLICQLDLAPEHHFHSNNVHGETTVIGYSVSFYDNPKGGGRLIGGLLTMMDIPYTLQFVCSAAPVSARVEIAKSSHSIIAVSIISVKL